jgi:hypothetical protein
MNSFKKETVLYSYIYHDAFLRTGLTPPPLAETRIDKNPDFTHWGLVIL